VGEERKVVSRDGWRLGGEKGEAKVVYKEKDRSGSKGS
jgi:hypothetical protein